MSDYLNKRYYRAESYSGEHIYFREFKVVRETYHSIWLKEIGRGIYGPQRDKLKLMRKNCRAKFAWETENAALESLIIRKERAIGHFNRKIEESRNSIALAHQKLGTEGAPSPKSRRFALWH